MPIQQKSRSKPAMRALQAGPALGLLALLLACPGESIQGIEEGLRCCAGQIIPALFPFFVVTNLIADGPAARLLGRALRPAARALGLESEQAPTALLLGWLGGFAVAANCTAQLYRKGELGKEEAERLLVSAVGSGPAFVVNSVGLLMLGSYRAGIVMMASLLLANFCCGMLARPAPVPCPNKPAPPYKEDAAAKGLVGAVRCAVDSTLTVCGFVLFFRFLCVVLSHFVPRGGWAHFALCAALEVTSGCLAGAQLGPMGAYACCAALSVQSLSVLLQVRALLPKELSMRPLLFCRVGHLALSLLFLWAGLRLWPAEAAVFSSLAPQVLARRRMALDTALLLFFLCCTVLRALTPDERKKTAAPQSPVNGQRYGRG